MCAEELPPTGADLGQIGAWLPLCSGPPYHHTLLSVQRPCLALSVALPPNPNLQQHAVKLQTNFQHVLNTRHCKPHVHTSHAMKVVKVYICLINSSTIGSRRLEVWCTLAGVVLLCSMRQLQT